MKNQEVCCRQCGSRSTKNLGPMVSSAVFAGVPLIKELSGTFLHRCSECSLVYRYPILSGMEYGDLYSKAPAETYRHTSLRHDQILVKGLLEKYKKSGDVLDVGCYDGLLLSKLDPSYKKFGIEASRAAREECERLGINVIANVAEDLPHIDRDFDAIVAVDLIEHLVNPSELIANAAAKLRNSGVMIVSTGDSDCSAWKSAGGRYWYCSFPEHLSFISESWANKVAKANQLEVVEVLRFRHFNPSISLTKVKVKAMLRAVAGRSESLLCALGLKDESLIHRKIGYPGLVNDHIAIVLRRICT